MYFTELKKLCENNFFVQCTVLYSMGSEMDKKSQERDQTDGSLDKANELNMFFFGFSSREC